MHFLTGQPNARMVRVSPEILQLQDNGYIKNWTLLEPPPFPSVKSIALFTPKFYL